jgi:hypothetical protein
MSKRRQKLKSQIGAFLRQYQRKAEPGWDPNDRSYDRQLEGKLERMSRRNSMPCSMTLTIRRRISQKETKTAKMRGVENINPK